MDAMLLRDVITNKYIRLMRLYQPTGIYLLLLPCLWGFALADFNLENNWLQLSLFVIGAVLMRGAGCIINDIIDRDFDKQVERTKLRPIAAGEISVKQALAMLFALLIASLCILIQFNFTTIILGMLSIIPVAIYPLMKRFTYWPQLFLGFTFNWGILMAYSAVNDEISIEAVILYLAAIFWTLGYDTIYACQDISDDLIAGVKSTAIRLQKNLKIWLYAFYSAFIFLIAIMMLISDRYGGISLILLIIPALHLYYQVWSLEPDSGGSAHKAFKSNVITGLLILIALYQ